MNLARIAGGVGLQVLNRLFTSATLTIYSGSIPANPETAASGTALVAWTFSAPPFGSATYGSSLMTATATFVAASVAPSNSGTAGYARAALVAAAWTGTHAYAYGTIVSNSSNWYLCVGTGTSASSGGPTTTAEGITDGGATWDYIGPTSGTGALADYTVGTSGTDIVLGTTTISTGTNVNITSFTQSIPVV